MFWRLVSRDLDHMTYLVAVCPLVYAGPAGALLTGASIRAMHSTLAQDPVFLIARARALLLAQGNDALAHLGLKVRPYCVLSLSSEDSPLSQREIATYLSLDQSQVVAIIDNLQGRSLVERQSAPHDRRVNVVVATPKGLDLLEQARDALGQAPHALNTQFSDEDRQLLTRLLQRIALPELLSHHTADSE